MFALATLDATGALSTATIVLLAVCVFVAVVGTRIVRAKQKQQVRKWRLERKSTQHEVND